MLARNHWSPKIEVEAKPKTRRLNSDRRRHLINFTAAILRQGEPTKFAFEGFCWHGLRSALCLEGWRWAMADATAADIVATALSRIGAPRPSWKEGQPWWTNSAATSFLRTTCARCGEQLPDQEPGWGHGQPRRYCSRSCAVGAFNDQHIEDNRAYDLARYHALKATAPERICETCGTPFRSVPQPSRPPARFCSNECYHKARTKRAKRHPWYEQDKNGIGKIMCQACDMEFSGTDRNQTRNV